MKTLHQQTITSAPQTMTGKVLLEEIAKSIVEDVYKKLRTEKASVFLCGKGLTAQSSMRSVFATALQTGPRSHMIKIMFPEDIFEELLAGSKSHDLLSLENLLAAAVDIVVVVLESAGAIAELGAFSNHKAISKKLIIMQDAKFRRDKSFINMGPVQFLRKSRKNSIFYYQGDDPLPAAEELRKQVLHFSKLAKKSSTPTPLNLLNIDMFLLPCLFLLDSPNRETLEDLVVIAIGKRKAKAVSIAVTAGLSSLRRQGLLRYVPTGLDFRGDSVLRTAAGVQLTQKGLSQFLKTNRRGQWKYFFKPQLLDRLRTLVLKAMYLKDSQPSVRVRGSRT